MESTTTTNKSLKEQIEQVLAQDRHVLNFEHYTPSPEHVQRMETLAKLAPELYDNPDITPRSKWFQHARYHQNSQMPPFHVHFRTETQAVIHMLYKALQVPESQQQSIRRAAHIFQSSMRGLQGHVSIEEYACFPLYQQTYPHVDVSFLTNDHKDLHKQEETTQKELSELSLQSSPSKQAIQETLGVVLDFDQHLLAHLGEEEEIVVPMSLTEKSIFF